MKNILVKLFHPSCTPIYIVFNISNKYLFILIIVVHIYFLYKIKMDESYNISQTIQDKNDFTFANVDNTSIYPIFSQNSVI